MSDLPSGTVTFMFTDIEGSTHLAHRLGERFASLIGNHNRLLRLAFDRHSGHELGTAGDSFFVAFDSAHDALAAAVDAQQALARHTWPDRSQVLVRMGLHTGEPMVSDAGYLGLDLHRAARISAAASGGHILLSRATAELAGETPGVALRDLGEHRLRDLPRAEHLFGVEIAGLPRRSPPLRVGAGSTGTPVTGREKSWRGRRGRWSRARSGG